MAMAGIYPGGRSAVIEDVQLDDYGCAVGRESCDAAIHQEKAHLKHTINTNINKEYTIYNYIIVYIYIYMSIIISMVNSPKAGFVEC